jgi:hypothetical protein
MNRLVVNPNKPDTWEIQLKDGENRLGRGDAVDFKIGDGSVSSSHCQIIVNDGTVSIQDLGSTNGTFVNDAPVQMAGLKNGQAIRLGNVEMIFYADAPQLAVAAPPPPTTPRLRVSGTSHESASPAPSATNFPPPLLAPTIDIRGAAEFCKFHPKSHGRWFCGKCNRSFCDLCVNSRNVGEASQKMCRNCGVECAPLEVNIAAPEEKKFLASLPGAFIYPFRGTGILILVFSALLFAALGVRMAGIFSIIIKLGAIGYLFSYMQNIIHATANEEAQMPELPGMDDLFGGFLRLAGTVVMSFGLSLGLMVAKFYEVDVPVSAIIITIILGCLYFPMAFLAVAMKDNVMASNPLVVVPSILRVPLPYLVTVILFASIFGVQQIGNMISSGAGTLTLTTTKGSVFLMAIGFKIIWSFVKVYLLTVNMRIMGLLYLTQKEKLGWYD